MHIVRPKIVKLEIRGSIAREVTEGVAPIANVFVVRRIEKCAESLSLEKSSARYSTK